MEPIVVFHCNAFNIYCIVDSDIYTSKTKMEPIFVFHCNAFNIYYTADSDIYTSTIKRERIVVFHCTPSFIILLTATYIRQKQKWNALLCSIVTL